MKPAKNIDKCPHCSAPLAVSLFAKAEAESSLTLTLTPKEGSYLSVATIGRTMVNMEQLIRAAGKEMGVKSAVFLRDATVENHCIKVEMLIVNAGVPAKREAG